MRNEDGYSWSESILAFVIVVVIFGTLLPLYANMSAQLERKKKEMHASEAAYHAAILYRAYGMTHGIVAIADVTFNWRVTEDAICVSYADAQKEFLKCLDG